MSILSSGVSWNPEKSILLLIAHRIDGGKRYDGPNPTEGKFSRFYVTPTLHCQGQTFDQSVHVYSLVVRNVPLRGQKCAPV